MSPLYGLVLAGGASTRMGQDKAALHYGGRTQLANAFAMLDRHVERTFVSVRNTQQNDPTRAPFPQIVDNVTAAGPAVGILSAHATYPDAAWLVLACDLPMLDDATLAALIAARDEQHVATAFRSEHDGLPEPLCTIWEPGALEKLKSQVDGGRFCPRKCLLNIDTLILPPRTPGALDNVNTPQERAIAQRFLEDACRA
ncbi:bifunctional molybdenum cofactor biosynthesis protein MoaAD [Neoasaia chiangmaiensis NBRC 101099]|uniref:Molybdenum cofactor guanylyltransferase n=1 Tax=Neoasaia chiangmaiensis TaxID=320497 RepID=A0A1U9KSL4_9PROT|nr:NTP transferase domain-containing protein [Neoasaia chiangmaiensis]AQS88650.1 molybdenum cofactor guanylyltransferase [Neoasaia chiangmaiensis]GBR41159.1 bifunctional molybdenum cofactor biosynthesis protein MoaAD [Neoasaia chiangmaiensis NBRC 101099]GEN13588.1 hypothetical protein NCH01_00190 [Neoasaia chiangmaiensis]